MKLPCTLNKFMVFEILIPELISKENWDNFFTIEDKLIISNSIVNSLEKLQEIFIKSQILENSSENIFPKKNEGSFPNDEKILFGSFKIVFYPLV